MTAILATTADGRRLRLEAALGDNADPCATCPPDRNTRLAELLVHVEPDGAAPGTTDRTLAVCGQCIAEMLIAGIVNAQQATTEPPRPSFDPTPGQGPRVRWRDGFAFEAPSIPCNRLEGRADGRQCTRPGGHAGPCRA